MKEWKKWPENKPEKDGKYIICFPYMDEDLFAISKYDTEENLFTSLSHSIKYWLELPELPTELHDCESDQGDYCYQEEAGEPFRFSIKSSIQMISINKRVKYCPICGEESPVYEKSE